MNKPIRILQVLGWLNIGGAETMVMNLYRNIDRTKIQFDFIIHSAQKGDFTDEILSLGGRIYSIPKYKVINHFEYKNAWKDFFNNHKEYRIIHTHVRSTAPIFLKIAKKYGLITISHSHSSKSSKGFIELFKSILQRGIKHHSDYMFACSLSAGRWLFGKNSITKNNFYILKNAIDSKKFTFNLDQRIKIRNELNINDKIVLGHVGRLNYIKNQSFLIDILNVLLKKNKKYFLVLVGEGSIMKQLVAKAKEYGIQDNIIFIGSSDRVNELMQAFDLFVFPSLFEGLGISVIEAQAAGLQCVISDKVPSEAILTKNVCVVPLCSNEEIWAKKILNSDKENGHNNTYDIIAEDGYDIGTTADWLTNFYKKILLNELTKYI